MKIRQCIHILAVLLLITGFVLPVMAAENETADAATAFYNSGVLLLEEKEYARAIADFRSSPGIKYHHDPVVRRSVVYVPE